MHGQLNVRFNHNKAQTLFGSIKYTKWMKVNAIL